MNESKKAIDNYSENICNENDELIIEDNTIYEIDLTCYECLMKRKQRNNK